MIRDAPPRLPYARHLHFALIFHLHNIFFRHVRHVDGYAFIIRLHYPPDYFDAAYAVYLCRLPVYLRHFVMLDDVYFICPAGVCRARCSSTLMPARRVLLMSAMLIRC